MLFGAFSHCFAVEIYPHLSARIRMRLICVEEFFLMRILAYWCGFLREPLNGEN